MSRKGELLALKLRVFRETDIDTCSRICRLATEYGHLAERYCERDLTDRERKRERAIERSIGALAKTIRGVKAVTFLGDPRGATVKLVLRDGRADDWGNTGICVPGS